MTSKFVLLGCPEGGCQNHNFMRKLLELEDDGDKQCIEINALLSEELMLFQQFCCSVVGEYEQVQPQICNRATTFYALPVPLPRQVYDLT